MKNDSSKILLGLLEESERLWAAAQCSLQEAPGSVVSLGESLDLGIRVAENLVTFALQPSRDSFPASISELLEEPTIEVDIKRDAIQVPRILQFIDAVDMLSADGLSCVSPRLHHGWEDRRLLCHRSREAARDITWVTIEEDARRDLLLLLAYRNRIFRVPPPVRIVPADILRAYPALTDLVTALRVGTRKKAV